MKKLLLTAAFLGLLISSVKAQNCSGSEPDGFFIRGNTNNDSSVNVSDISYLTNYLYQGGPSPCEMDSADVNDDGGIDLSDVTYLSNYLYQGGPAPPYPFASSSVDYTEDNIANETSPMLVDTDGLYGDPLLGGTPDWNPNTVGFVKKAYGWLDDEASSGWTVGANGIDGWDFETTTDHTTLIDNEYFLWGRTYKVWNASECLHESTLNIIDQVKFNYDGICPGGCTWGAEPLGNEHYAFSVNIKLQIVSKHQTCCDGGIRYNGIYLYFGIPPSGENDVHGTVKVKLRNRTDNTSSTVTILDGNGPLYVDEYKSTFPQQTGFCNGVAHSPFSGNHNVTLDLFDNFTTPDPGTTIDKCRDLTSLSLPSSWDPDDRIGIEEVEVNNLSLWFDNGNGADAQQLEELSVRVVCEVEWKWNPEGDPCQ